MTGLVSLDSQKSDSLVEESMERSTPKGGWLVFLFLIVGFLSSCSGIPPIKESSPPRILENVPFYPQEIYQCGPASLAGIFNFWGITVSPEEIAGEIYSRSARGTLNLDMVLYTERKGLTAHQYRGSLEDIKRKIDSGYPLIVLVDYGFWVYQRNHFMVVFGYREDGFIVHSGLESDKFLPLEDFLKSWERTRFWTLLITPQKS
jgi:ABC-type bacteriocin/lantibiotic exporter with double-glycine peptidase domain